MLRYIFFVVFFGIGQLLFSQQQFTVFFDSDKFLLNSKENSKLNQWISENRKNKIVAINGYADESGTTLHNDTLAQKRVDFVFKQIQNKVPIRDDFKTRSFGEKFQQSVNKAENRKVVIYYILEKDLPHEDEILGIKKEGIPENSKTDPNDSELAKQIEYPDKLIFENPDGTQTEFRLNTAFMKKVGESKTGEKLKLENLNFVINTFVVENASRGKMYELLVVMQKNPKLKIEIQGHLCCQSVDRYDLSTQRAKAIYSFLIANAIDKNRLSYKGLGSSQPIYPLPEKNEQERAANRRVEILIVEN